MSTPPTPVPPRREGRRFTIPTPADLRYPGKRSDRPDVPDEPAPSPPEALAGEEPVAPGSDRLPEASTGPPEAPPGAAVATGEERAEQPARPADPGHTGTGYAGTGHASPGQRAPAIPAAPTPPAPRRSRPTPGNLPRPTVPAGRAADTTAAQSTDIPESAGEASRRLFPNPATLLAAGRGVRKVRSGGLRGRRLPKVEETSAGGVVLDLSCDPPAVALIARHDRRSRLLWSLPKGHVEEGETPEEAALREVFEETGLVGRIVAPLGIIDFWFVVEDKRIHKTVHHFVIEAVGGELSDEDVEVEAVEWIPFHQVVRKLAYGDERRLVEKVSQIVPGVT